MLTLTPIRPARAALVNPSFCRKAVIFRAESALLAGAVAPGQAGKSPYPVMKSQHEVPRDGERDPTRNAFDAFVKFRSYFHDLATYPAKRTLAALSAFISTYPANFRVQTFRQQLKPR